MLAFLFAPQWLFAFPTSIKGGLPTREELRTVRMRSALNSSWVGVSAFFLAASWSWAAPSPASPETSEIRLGLPEGGPFSVSVQFGEGGIQVELPRGAAVPFDLERAGGGIVRGGQLTTISDTRVRLSLSLVSGTLDEV